MFETGSFMLDYIKRTFKRTNKDTELYEAMTDVVIDIKKRTLAEEFKVEAYTTGITALGDYKLPVPFDFGHLIGDMTIIDEASQQAYCIIRKVSKETFDELYPERLLTGGNQERGIPQHFCLFAEMFHLGPAPDDASYLYQINYTTEAVVDIDSDTTEVPFTDKNRYMVKCGALSKIYYDMGFDQEGAKWEAKYEQELQKYIDNDDFNIEPLSNMNYSEI